MNKETYNSIFQKEIHDLIELNDHRLKPVGYCGLKAALCA